jgi:hypothetical protein
MTRFKLTVRRAMIGVAIVAVMLTGLSHYKGYGEDCWRYGFHSIGEDRGAISLRFGLVYQAHNDRLSFRVGNRIIPIDLF